MSSRLMLLEAVMVICCAFPVSRSLAVTFTMPLASIENVTSICGTPLGARADAGQLEAAKFLILVRHGALAL